MNNQIFSSTEAISHGWDLMKKNFWFLAGLLLFIFLVSVTSGGIPVFSFLVGIFGSISLLTAVLEMYDGRQVKMRDLFNKYDMVFSYLISSIIYAVVVVVGLILLIVPGIYWAVKYQFYKLLVVDKNMEPIEALRESGKITKGHIWQLLGFVLLITGINILGLLALGIGLLVTIPTTIFATIHVYRKLLAANAVSAVTS